MSISRNNWLIAALLLAFSAGLGAAVTYDNDATTWKATPSGTSWTNTFTVGAGSNQVLFVWIDYEASFTVSSMYYGSQTMTAVRSDTAGSLNFATLYYLVGPATTLQSITVNFSAAIWNPVNFTAFSYSGVDQAAPGVSNNTATNGGPAGPPWSLSNSITPANSGSTIVELSNLYNSGTGANAVAWANGTARYSTYDNLNNADGLAIADDQPGFSGTPFSYNPSFSGGNAGTGQLIVEAVELDPLPANTVNAACGSPVVDGNLGDSVWSSSTVKTMVACSTGPCPGTGGSAQFQVAYDSTNLYVAFNVVEPNLFANAGAPWNGSATEIFLDFANDRGGTMDGADYQFVTTYNSSTIATYRNGGGIGTPGGIVAASVVAGGGYTMEVKIPWASIGVSAPSVAQISSIDAGVDFSNAAKTGRDHQYGAWSPGNTPNNWGFAQYQSCGPTPTFTNTPISVATSTPTFTPAACGSPNLCSDTFTRNGTAALIRPGEIQMTQASAWNAGTAWDPNTVDLTKSFNYSFQMNFGTINNGADGMTFTLQEQGLGAIGDAGGDLAIDTQAVSGGPSNTKITPAVSVEFDTYQNSGANPPNDNDPAYDHIMIDENGSVNHLAGGACPASVTTSSGSCPVQANGSGNIKDGAWHNVQITWDATNHVMQVFFDGALRVTYSKDIVNQIFGGNNCAYVGFTGATGGQVNDQRVRLCTYTPVNAACGSPVIDGALTDTVWTGQSFTSVNDCSSPTCPGTGGSGTFAVAYDSTNLYVAFNVTDPHLYANNGAPWNGSAVEVFLDPTNDLGATMDSGDYQIVFTYSSSAVVAYRNGGAIGLPAGVTSQSVVGAGTYTIETVIPWASIGVAAPSAGTHMGFDAAVDFANTGLNARDHQYGYENPANNPNAWGQIQFGACVPTNTPSVSPTATRSGTVTVTPSVTPNACLPTYLSSSTNSTTSSTTSWAFGSVTVAGANPLLLVRVALSSGVVNSITLNGQPLAFVRGEVGDMGWRMETWYLKAPPAGPFPLVINLSVSGTVVASATIYNNTDQITPIGASSITSSFSVTAFSSNLTTLATNSLISNFVLVSSSDALTLGNAAQHQEWNNASISNQINGDDLPAAAPGPYTMHYNLSFSTNVDGQMVEIRSACNQPTLTPSQSATTTVTPSATRTATVSATPSITLSASQTSTPGPSFTISPTYTVVSCLTAPTFKTASQLQAGQDGNNVASDTFSYTLPAPLTSGLLVIPISYDTTDTISSITYNGSTLSLFHTAAAVNSGAMSIYYLALGAMSGAHNLIINFSPNAQNHQWVIQAQVYDNVSQTTPFGAYSFTSGISTAAFSTTLTTTQPSSLVLNYMDDNNNAIDTLTHSVPQNWTLAVGDGTGYHVYSDYITAGSAGLQTMSYNWTPSGQTINSQMMEIIGVPCPPTPTPTWTITPSSTPTPVWQITKTSCRRTNRRCAPPVARWLGSRGSCA